MGAGTSTGLDTSSTAYAVNTDVNNRWLHDSEIIKIFGKKTQLEQFAKEHGITYEEAWRAVLAQAYRNTDDNFRKTHQSSAESKLSKAAEDFLRKNDLYIKTTAQERANSNQNINNERYKPLLNSVLSNTPKQTQQQVNQTVLTQTAKTSAVGAAKGIGNIPSDTANGVANIFHREVKPTFPYSNEEEANVGAVAQNVVGTGAVLVGVNVKTSGNIQLQTQQSRIASLQLSGIKVNPENVVLTGVRPNGQIVFLETGNSRAGLQHVIERHENEFGAIGVSKHQIPSVLITTLEQNKLVGYQGGGRPIYETTINGQTRYIAITVGDNGFIVGANPASKPKK